MTDGPAMDILGLCWSGTLKNESAVGDTIVSLYVSTTNPLTFVTYPCVCPFVRTSPKVKSDPIRGKATSGSSVIFPLLSRLPRPSRQETTNSDLKRRTAVFGPEPRNQRFSIRIDLH